MTRRRKGRELALQMLYQIDITGKRTEPVFHSFWEMQESEPNCDTVEFSEELVNGTLEHEQEIDDLIEKTSTNWRLSRMSVVDRNILRMAVFEFIYLNAIPVSVTMDEAIEVAKRFGSPDSPAFINGILDTISKIIPEKKTENLH